MAGMSYLNQQAKALVSLLATGDDLDRCGACRVLGKVAVPGVTDDLVARLRDDDIDVCVSAVEALSDLGDPSAVPALLASLENDPSGEVKTAVVEALGNLGGEQAVRVLVDVAERPPEEMVWDEEEWDPWWDMQLKAVEALGRLRVPEAVPVLAGILDQEDGQVIESEVLSALVRIGTTGEAVVIGRIDHPSAQARRRAVDALGEAGSGAGIRALSDALDGDDEDVKVMAISALARRKSLRHLRRFLLMLKDESADVRRASLDAIATLSITVGAALDLEELIPVAHDRDPKVRAAAVGVLAALLPEGGITAVHDQLPVWLGDPEVVVAMAACRLAERFHDPETGEELLALLDDQDGDARIRACAAQALVARGSSDEAVVASLSRAHLSDNRALRVAAVTALVELGRKAEGDPPLALMPLLETLKGLTPVDDEAVTMAAGETPGAVSAPTLSMASPEAVAASQAVAALSENTGNGRVVQSTLDGIALENIEAVVQIEAAAAAGKAVDQITLDEQDRETLQDYLAILDRQKEQRRILFESRPEDMQIEMRQICARMLAGAPGAEVVRALIKALSDPAREVRKDAATSLARIAREAPDTPGLGDALGRLITYAYTAEPELQHASIDALGRLGNTAAVPPLLECVENQDPVVRSLALNGLGRLLKQHMINVPLQMSGADAPDNPIETMIARLQDSDPMVVRAAAKALAGLADELPSQGLKDDLAMAMIAAGIVGEGLVARPMGKALRDLDRVGAADALVAQLPSVESSLQRRFLLEMLEEVWKQDAVSA
jgi:HEAT repeat protein